MSRLIVQNIFNIFDKKKQIGHFLSKNLKFNYLKKAEILKVNIFYKMILILKLNINTHTYLQLIQSQKKSNQEQKDTQSLFNN